MPENPLCADLFLPVRIGRLQLANGIVMAPMTRARADAEGVPTALMAEYYAQRSSACLIISEGVNISPQARGYAFTAGLHSAAQIEGWARVTAATRARGGLSTLRHAARPADGRDRRNRRAVSAGGGQRRGGRLRRRRDRRRQRLFD